jgi:hypothetical protein
VLAFRNDWKRVIGIVARQLGRASSGRLAGRYTDGDAESVSQPFALGIRV